MKIIFFGTSEFAAESLKKLVSSGYDCLSVVTRPDKQKGRFLKVLPSPVKIAAEVLGIPVMQPEILDGELAKKLKDMAPDIFVVIAYGHILKKEMLSVPRLYSINVHASLLPEYRGAAPINWAVIDGCDRTGVSVIRMNEKMDGGDVMASAACRIEEDDTAFSLETRLSRMGADLLTDTLGQIKAGRENFVPQDETKFSYARKLAKTDGAIDWTMDAVRINNKVRGVIPWPGAFTGFNGQKINIWKSGVFKGGIPDNVPPGTVIDCSSGSIITAAGSGALSIFEVQLEGKKRLGVTEFLRGYRSLKAGSRFTPL